MASRLPVSFPKPKHAGHNVTPRMVEFFLVPCKTIKEGTLRLKMTSRALSMSRTEVDPATTAGITQKLDQVSGWSGGTVGFRWDTKKEDRFPENMIIKRQAFLLWPIWQNQGVCHDFRRFLAVKKGSKWGLFLW